MEQKVRSIILTMQKEGDEETSEKIYYTNDNETVNFSLNINNNIDRVISISCSNSLGFLGFLNTLIQNGDIISFSDINKIEIIDINFNMIINNSDIDIISSSFNSNISNVNLKLKNNIDINNIIITEGE